MKLKKYYYLYYAGMFFTLLASIATVLSANRYANTDFFEYRFFALGLTLGLIASIKYWGWLLKEIYRR